ncbi:MAG: class I SAM-dependent methyltransferase [Dehalococcoidales bacterium]|nr:MAG: class I SAM-dependent methyltransferase [Dehalococcoidales bacterium]
MSSSINAWDEIFKQRSMVFPEPHEDMPGIVKLLKGRGASTVLDLGSGTGRHVVYLAKNGFSVYGLDSSSVGVKATRQWLKNEGLKADLKLGSMTEQLPYADAFFNAVISVQVLHHANSSTIVKVVGEITRVLNRDGLIFITVPKLKNQGDSFEQVEPNTFIPLDGPEKGILHHYFTSEELREVFVDFDIKDIHLDTVNHYCLLAFKQ